MVDDNVITQSLFINEWVNENIMYFKMQYPIASEERLREILTDIAKRKIVNHKAHLHNDYQDDVIIEADLLKLYDWYHINKPIAAGNGTFFYNQNIKYCPVQGVIDGRIADRKHYQKVRDEYLGENGDTSSYYYGFYDTMQMEAKVMINAIYGSFGTRTFQLYNPYTAASTTGTAQSLISTTAMAFEAYLSNAVKFKSLNEMMAFLGNIIEKDDKTHSLRGFTIYSDKEMIFEHLKGMFVSYDEAYTPILKRILQFRTPDELTRIYYKNNLYAFMENPIIVNRVIHIFNITTSFRNPNNVPENIKEDLEFIWEYCSEFVFYNHAYSEQINRLKHDTRSTVTLIDTDSNVVNIQPWIDWCKSNIWVASNTIMDTNDKEFCSVNVIAYLVTRMARELLDRYTKDCHVLEENRARINIKNEFYFYKMLLANVKKRYLAQIKLKEGKQVNKLEIKGYDFKKAGSSADTEQDIISIIKKNIIEPEEINAVSLMTDVSRLEKKVRTSLKNKERTYLVRMNCKVAKVYAEPYSEGAFTGPLLWNTIYPDNEILIPDKCDIVFINIPNEKVLANKLGTKYPEIAKIISDNIFHGGIPSFEKNGVKYLALPNDGSPIPEWVSEVMDTERIVTRNVGTFYPVLKSLAFTTITAGDNEYASNILNI